jgi:Na+/proline symporter
VNIFQGIFVFFIAVFIAISLWSSRKGVSLRDFYIMEGNAGSFLIAGTYLATWISAVGLVGLSAVSYSSSIASGVLTWGAFPGFVISAFFIGNRLRRFGQVTLGDYYEARFGGKDIRLLSTVITVVGLGAYFISQLIGSALITESVLGIPYNVMLPLMVAVFGIIAVTGGAKTVTITDTLMLVIIAVSIGLVFAPMFIHNIGLENISLYAKENPNFFKMTAGGTIGWGTIIGWQVLWCFGNAANPASITRAYLAKDARTWVKAIMLSLIICIPVVWMAQIAAGLVRLVEPNLKNPAQAIIWAATSSYVPPLVGALAIAGLFAAVLSTASTQILMLAFSVSRDIYERFTTFSNDEERDKKSLFMARLWIAIFAVLAVALAWGRPTYIALVGNFGSSVFAAAFFPALIMGLWWKKTTKAGAYASMAVGLALDAVLSFYPLLFLNKPLAWAEYLPFGIHPVIWSLIVAMVVLVVVSKMTQNSITEEQSRVYEVCQTLEPKPATSSTSLVIYAIVTGLTGVLLLLAVCWFATYCV